MFNNQFQEIIALPTSEGFTMTQVKDVLYVQSMNGNYCDVYFTDGTKILLTRQLNELETFLPNSIFIRVHQQYLVNKFYVKKYHRENGVLILQSDENIPVSVRKKKLLTTFFKTLV